MQRIAHPLRATAAVVAAVGLLVGLCGPARADGFGKVNCDLNPASPECTASVQSGIGGGTNAGNTGTASSAGALVCTFQGKSVACVNGFGWYGGDGCYYRKDASGFLPPQEWIKACIDPATGDVHEVGTVVLLQPPQALEAAIHRAVSQLGMPAPVIAASPALESPQVVQVPVWWWIDPRVWAPRSTTAAVPGIALTVTATPQRITWDTGDGTSTVCAGPGTPWTAKYAPTADSPTCGHRYAVTSRRAPGGTFTVRATITWSISWAGGGMSGTEPDATTTAAAPVQVTELRAVITG